MRFTCGWNGGFYDASFEFPGNGAAMRQWMWVVAMAMACSGCAVVAVADAVVTTGAVIVKTGVKATGAVVDAVIPD